MLASRFLKSDLSWEAHRRTITAAQAADLYAVAAQAAAQVDRARQSAKASVQAALSQKPKFKLHVTLDAPKVAIPIPATPGTPDGTTRTSCSCMTAHHNDAHAGSTAPGLFVIKVP